MEEVYFMKKYLNLLTFKQIRIMDNNVNLLKKTARLSGFLFLLWIIFGLYDMIFISSKIFIKGDIAASSQNILSQEFLFRTGIFSGLIANFIWILLVLTFYRLFKSVNDFIAKLLVAFVIIQVPVAFIKAAFSFAALMILKGEVLMTFDIAQRQDLANLFLKLNNYCVYALELSWGLWLFPLAILVYHSKFIPRFIGIWLLINGSVYVLLSFLDVVLPQYRVVVFTYGMPAMFGELVLMLWLLIFGIREKKTIPTEGIEWG